MAKLLRMPSTGSIYDASGSVPGSSSLGKAIWLGLAVPAGASGSVMWYRGGSPVSGSVFLPLSSCGGAESWGPFFLMPGVYVTVSTACALYYTE